MGSKAPFGLVLLLLLLVAAWGPAAEARRLVDAEQISSSKIPVHLKKGGSLSSYHTGKITEIKPEAFCKQYGLCRDIALFSGVRSSNSTCVFCHHLLDEVMSKLQDPDAEEV